MTDNVVDFTGSTRVEVSPSEVLKMAEQWGMTRCIIIGEDDDGLMMFGGSFSDTALINLLLDRAKAEVLANDSTNMVRSL